MVATDTPPPPLVPVVTNAYSIGLCLCMDYYHFMPAHTIPQCCEAIAVHSWQTNSEEIALETISEETEHWIHLWGSTSHVAHVCSCMQACTCGLYLASPWMPEIWTTFFTILDMPLCAKWRILAMHSAVWAVCIVWNFTHSTFAHKAITALNK